jgi:hypothetical protein
MAVHRSEFRNIQTVLSMYVSGEISLFRTRRKLFGLGYARRDRKATAWAEGQYNALHPDVPRSLGRRRLGTLGYTPGRKGRMYWPRYLPRRTRTARLTMAASPVARLDPESPIRCRPAQLRAGGQGRSDGRLKPAPVRAAGIRQKHERLRLAWGSSPPRRFGPLLTVEHRPWEQSPRNGIQLRTELPLASSGSWPAMNTIVAPVATTTWGIGGLRGQACRVD